MPAHAPPSTGPSGAEPASPRAAETSRRAHVVQLLCAALFVGTTFCSLWLSASSTLHKAELVHVPSGAVWSAVGVLELVSLAGTMRWLIARNRRGRVHAIGVVAAVAVVTGFAGWAAYGWFGLVAPIAVVATIHMVHETLDDLAPAEQRWGGPDEVAPIAVEASTPPALEPSTAPEIEAGKTAEDDPETAPVPVRLHAVDSDTHTACSPDPLRVPGAHRTWRQARPLAQELGVTRRSEWSVGDLNAAIDEALREVSA